MYHGIFDRLYHGFSTEANANQICIAYLQKSINNMSVLVCVIQNKVYYTISILYGLDFVLNDNLDRARLTVFQSLLNLQTLGKK